VPTALPAVVAPSDETSESAHSPSDSEDGNPPVPAPERPWSPSVPAALSTLASRRHNNARRKAEQPENANSSSETQPSLCTEVTPRPGTPTPTPLTPPSPVRTRSARTKSNSFVPGGFVSGLMGPGLPPPSSFFDEDSKVSGLFTAQQFRLNGCQHSYRLVSYRRIFPLPHPRHSGFHALTPTYRPYALLKYPHHLQPWRTHLHRV
jgi:hypothetical protein